MMTDNFIAVNFSYKSTDRHSVGASLIRHYLDQLAEIYAISENDASNIFLRTENGREYFVAYALAKGIVMEYYEFFENSEYKTASPIAYGFRLANNEALTRELLEVQA